MKNKLSSIFFFIIIGILFVDIGNPNALRQGTEGFYLLIGQEMFEANDLLTPRVYGEFHWSKPPFQFWLPMPFYYLFGDNFLFWGRISVLLFSLVCSFLISLWYENELKRNWSEAFGMLLIPLYFIKYARIFMMEMALAYLTTIAALYFYSYFKRGGKVSLIWGSLIGGLSVLVKGPVSLVMLSPPVVLYSIYSKRTFPSRAFLYLVLAAIFGSLWFILSYFRFGEDFFHYFFIRENLGKFNSKSYPISSVIQGLFIYSFPVCILLLPTFKNLRLKDLLTSPNLYFILCFTFYYFIWFLPKQKSHHYAVPSIPFLILFLCYNLNENLYRFRNFYLKVLTYIGHSFFGLGFLVLALIFYFKDSLVLCNARFYILGCFFCVGLWTKLITFNNVRLRFLKFIIPFVFLWQFLLPLGILPTVPDSVSKMIPHTAKLFVSYRKPFFIEETLSRDIHLLPQNNLMSPEVKSGDYVFVGRSDLLKQLPGNFQMLHSWPVWKRGARLSHVVNALKRQDIKVLQENFALIRKL